MPKSPWSKEQSAWLLSKVEDWKIARIKPKGYRAVHGLTPRAVFMNRLLEDFQNTFPPTRWTEEVNHGFVAACDYYAVLRK
ncbi:hypothetical protein FRC08_018526, partial [Ceratobasidium sp. 394]